MHSEVLIVGYNYQQYDLFMRYQGSQVILHAWETDGPLFTEFLHLDSPSLGMILGQAYTVRSYRAVRL